MIEETLKAKIGLNVESIGAAKVRADVSRRMEACGVKRAEDYERLLDESPEELASLVEIITVPETWFFRGKESFAFLERHLKEEWMVKAILKGERSLKALSVPCSSGEEPYSISMTMLSCGLAPELFSIDAMDINRAVLEKARKGVYTRNSFRGGGFQSMGRYFKEERDGLVSVAPEVKRPVSFVQANLLELPLPPSPPYDIVFCRNMLIYFDAECQHRAIEILDKLLKDDGLLFLGHAEAGIMLGKSFAHVEARGSFAFRKIKPGPACKLKSALKGKEPSSRWKPAPAHAKEEQPHRKARPARKAPALPPESGGSPQTPLQKAESLANRGELAKAASLCDDHIKASKLDPQGYLLKGVIMMSLKQEAEAERLFGKALFLKSDCYEALLHLATLKESRGDLKAAKLFKERAGRVKL